MVFASVLRRIGFKKQIADIPGFFNPVAHDTERQSLGIMWNVVLKPRNTFVFVLNHNPPREES